MSIGPCGHLFVHICNEQNQDTRTAQPATMLRIWAIRSPSYLRTPQQKEPGRESILPLKALREGQPTIHSLQSASRSGRKFAIQLLEQGRKPCR